MQIKTKKAELNAGRFGPAHDELLPRLLQTNLRQLPDQEYARFISSLWHSVRETQSTDAYLLLAEACAQAGLTEMALATLDVLSCVEPDRSEAEMMKAFLRKKNDSCAESRNFFPSPDEHGRSCPPCGITRPVCEAILSR